jgi:hypothetical protein
MAGYLSGSSHLAGLLTIAPDCTICSSFLAFGAFKVSCHFLGDGWAGMHGESGVWGGYRAHRPGWGG